MHGFRGIYTVGADFIDGGVGGVGSSEVEQDKTLRLPGAPTLFSLVIESGIEESGGFSNSIGCVGIDAYCPFFRLRAFN